MDGSGEVKADTATPVVAVPSIGMSVLCNIADNYQATLQFFVPGDAPMKDIHAAMDKLTAVADRQSAKYALPKLRDEKRKVQGTIAMAEHDLANATTAEDAKRAAIEVQIKTIHDDHGKAREAERGKLNAELLGLNKERREVEENARAEAVAKGLRTPYELKGRPAQQANIIDSKINSVKHQLEALENEGIDAFNVQFAEHVQRLAEHDQAAEAAAQNIATTIEHCNKRIALIDEEIAEKEALLGD